MQHCSSGSTICVSSTCYCGDTLHVSYSYIQCMGEIKCNGESYDQTAL